MSYTIHTLILCAALVSGPVAAQTPVPTRFGTSNTSAPRLSANPVETVILQGSGITPDLVGKGKAAAITGDGQAPILVGKGNAPLLKEDGPAPTLIVAPSPPPKPDPIIIQDAFFALNSAILNASAKATIAKAAMMIRKSGSSNVRVTGHTDIRGSRALNERLSRARAQAVKSALVNLGIPAGQLTTIGRAYDDPVRTGSSEADHTANRRVEIHLR